jgi:hypothetical protein
MIAYNTEVEEEGRAAMVQLSRACRGTHSECLPISYRLILRREPPSFSCFPRVTACAVRASPLRRDPYPRQAAGVAREHMQDARLDLR